MKVTVDVCTLSKSEVAFVLACPFMRPEDITLTNSRAEEAEKKLVEAEDRIQELEGELAFVTAELDSSRKISSEWKDLCDKLGVGYLEVGIEEVISIIRQTNT